MSGLDLNKLEEKLNNALSNETSESLNNWLEQKRMSNNKQSSVEWVIENLTLIHALLSRREIGVEFFNKKYNEIVEQGKAMHEEEIENAWVGGKGCLNGEQYYAETFEGNNEQAMIDYNKMEEEWEMDNYNEIKSEQQ